MASKLRAGLPGSDPPNTSAAAEQHPSPLVFLSHASNDKLAAIEVCDGLESRGFSCWIAERNIDGGLEWAEAIVSALDSCRVVVLVLSAAANRSKQVRYEIECAASKGCTIIPIRLKNVKPAGALELLVGSLQWVDGFPAPLKDHFTQLFVGVDRALGNVRESPATAADGPNWETLATAIPKLEKLGEDRRALRPFLMLAIVFCAALMLGGSIALSQAPWATNAALVSLLFGLALLPLCVSFLGKLQKCQDAVTILSMAVDWKNPVAADKAINELTCFAYIQELLRDAR